MNGAENTRSIILEKLYDKIESIFSRGCPAGEIREEKIHNLTENIGDLRKTMREVNDKLWWGLLALVLIAFLAGVNVANEAVKLFIR